MMPKAKVFFFDSEDINTGDFFSLQDAIMEDFVRPEDDTIVPTDECSIVCWYEDEFNWDDWILKISQIIERET